MGHFVVDSKKKLAELDLGAVINESDFACMTDDGTFVQLKYVEEDSKPMESAVAKPGIYCIAKTPFGLVLEKTAFVDDSILKEFVNTEVVVDKCRRFYNRREVYRRYGFEIAKRGVLLYGPAGSGKTTIINEVVKEYEADKKTFILVWHTDQIAAEDVKKFVKHLKYEPEVEKMMLIVEDIGGVEIDNARIRSESSLLSLLDNQERTFKKDVLILATTNYPANFMGNLTNRPNRFDDKIEVGHPGAEARVKLLKFFDKENIVSERAIEKLKTKDCNEFTPAHLREIVVRTAIYDMPSEEVITQMLNEIKAFNKQFEKPGKAMGFYGSDD